MEYQWLDDYLLAKKGVRKDYKAEWNWDRYLLEDKMFAALCYDDKTGKAIYLTLKLVPEEGEAMRAVFPDIIPGYYMNKIHWNSIKVEGEMPETVIKDLLDKSYLLVLSSFSKKKQAEILK